MASFTLSNAASESILCDGSVVQLPSAPSESLWNFNVYPPMRVTPRNRDFPRYGKDGAKILGDGKTGARTIRIIVDASREEGAPESDMVDALNFLASFFDASKAPVYLTETERGRRALVVLKDLNMDEPAARYKVKVGGVIELFHVNSYWESGTETTVTSATGGTANGGTLSVNVSGYAEAFPEITVETLADLTSFTITNTTTGVFSQIASPNMLTGTEIVISSIERPYVTIGGAVDQIALQENSGLIRLQPGANILRYDAAGSAFITIAFRNRYFAP